MKHDPPIHHRRSAFTLVEMLVSTALIIFVMVILTQVFGYGLQSLRNFRGVGDLQEKLRQAGVLLRRDLASPHFGRESGPLNGPYLSQQRMDMYEWTPPKEGFFRVLQGSNSILEGTDGDGIPSYRATNHSLHFTVRMDVGSGQGTGRDRLFKVDPTQIPAAWMKGIPEPPTPQGPPWRLPPSELNHLSQDFDYCSRWAEIAYFLDKSGQTANGNDLFTLYRRKRIALDARVANKDFALTNPLIVPSPGVDERMVQPSMFRFPVLQRYFYNTPVDLTNPVRRFFNSFSFYQTQAMRKAVLVQQGALAVSPPDLLRDLALVNLAPVNEPQFMPLNKTPLFNAAMQQKFYEDNGGDDILLENVLSMEIRVNWDVSSDPRMQRYLVNAPHTGVVFDEPFDILPPSPSVGNYMFAGANGPFVFDTWCGTENYKFVPPPVTNPPTAAPPSPMNIPLRVRVKAIQVRLRVWDIKTQQTRQVTIVQDL